MTNETIKYLLPHFYITLAFLIGIAAIPQSIAFKDQYGTYCALMLWLLLLALLLLHNQERLPFVFTYKREKWFFIERIHKKKYE